MGKAIDILLYVALSEEFDVVIDMLGSDFKSQGYIHQNPVPSAV